MKNTAAMVAFIKRVVKSLGGVIQEPSSLKGFAPYHSGEKQTQSFERLVAELHDAEWTGFHKNPTKPVAAIGTQQSVTPSVIDQPLSQAARPDSSSARDTQQATVAPAVPDASQRAQNTASASVLADEATLDEAGYQRVAGFKDTPAMTAFVRRVCAARGGGVSNEYGLAGLVPFYSGEKFVQSFDALLVDLARQTWSGLSAPSSGVAPTGAGTKLTQSPQWEPPARGLPGPLRSRPVDRAQVAALDEVGYQQVAATQDTGAMSVYIHRVVKALGGRVSDEYKLLGTAPMYSGQISVKTLADLIQTLKVSEWSGVSAASSFSTTGTSAGDTRTQAPEDETMAVWITGYARSATSTVQSLVNAARSISSERKVPPEGVFSLFEPCHPSDDVAPELRYPNGCDKLLTSMAACDFSGINNLYEWENPHNEGVPHNKWPAHAAQYSKDLAREVCTKADVRIFKTITYGHHLVNDVLPVLEANPHFRVIDVVRDPRGIYASWKTSDTFKSLLKDGNKTLMADLCDGFEDDLSFRHPRFHRVVFEELVAAPDVVMKRVLKFLGFHYGPLQAAWVAKTFNADCKHEGMFLDCHKDSGASATKWQSVLSDAEKGSFSTNRKCRKVAEYFGFPHA